MSSEELGAVIDDVCQQSCVRCELPKSYVELHERHTKLHRSGLHLLSNLTREQPRQPSQLPLFTT